MVKKSLQALRNVQIAQSILAESLDRRIEDIMERPYNDGESMEIFVRSQMKYREDSLRRYGFQMSEKETLAWLDLINSIGIEELRKTEP